MAKYTEWLTADRLCLIEGWARDGLTDEQIAHNMGIASSTLREWKKKFSMFSAALKKGKEVVDYEVENALLKRALGYRYDEVTVEAGVETKRVTKEVAPDTTAQIFWLKNRRLDKWKNKPVPAEEAMEDDGFIEALTTAGADLDMTDDADMLPEDEEDEDETGAV